MTIPARLKKTTFFLVATPAQANVQNVNKFISIPWYAARGSLHFGSYQAASNYTASDPLQGNTSSPWYKATERRKRKSAFRIVKPVISEVLRTRHGASKPTQGPSAAREARSSLRSRDLAAGPLHTGAPHTNLNVLLMENKERGCALPVALPRCSVPSGRGPGKGELQLHWAPSIPPASI